MIQEIVLGIGVLIGLLFHKKTSPILLKLILLGLSVCYVFGLFNYPLTSTIGFIGFGVSSLVFGIYCAVKNLWISAIIGFFTVATIVHGIMRWPFYGEMQFIMIVPIICYIMICLNWRKHLNEFSILTILTFYMTTLFVDLISKWI